MGPTDFESTVLKSLGRIEEHMETTKATLTDHSQRINTLESERDIEQGEQRAHSTAFSWLKSPLQIASGGALTVLIQRIFNHH